MASALQEKQDSSQTDVEALSLARGTGTNLLGFASRVLLVFVHSLVGARLYGAEAYGIYSEGITVVILLSLVGQLGLGRTTLTRFVAMYRARGQARPILSTLEVVLSVAAPASIAVGLALWVWAAPIARFFGEPSAVTSFHILAFAVPLLSLATILAAFTQGFKHMVPKTLALDVVAPAAEVAFAVAVACFGLRRIGLAASYTMATAVSAAFLVFYVLARTRTLRAGLRDKADGPRAVPLRPLLAFALPVLAIDVLGSATYRVSVLLLGALGTTSMVGVFAILQRLVGLGNTFLVSLSAMFSPMVADLVERRQMGRLSRLYKASTRWALAVSLPVSLMLAVLGAEILQLFGREFQAGSTALQYLLVGQVFNVATGACAVVLTMAGYPQHSTINEAALLATVGGLSILLVPRYGLMGAVWAVASGTVLVNAMRVMQVWWRFHMQPFSASLLKVALAGGAMTVTLWLWKGLVLRGRAAWFLLALGGGSGLLAYGLVLFAAGMEDEELNMLRALRARLACMWSGLTERFGAARGL